MRERTDKKPGQELKEDDRSITFLASFPSIQSACKVGPDGMRIQLDISKSEMHKAIALQALMDCVLEVTVRVQGSSTNGETKTNSRAARYPLGVAGG